MSLLGVIVIFKDTVKYVFSIPFYIECLGLKDLK